MSFIASGRRQSSLDSVCCAILFRFIFLVTQNRCSRFLLRSVFSLQFYLLVFFANDDGRTQPLTQRMFENLISTKHMENQIISLVDLRFDDAKLFATACDCERSDLCLFIFALAFTPFPKHQNLQFYMYYVLTFDIAKFSEKRENIYDDNDTNRETANKKYSFFHFCLLNYTVSFSFSLCATL